jgi:cell division protein FtsA
MQDNLIIGLDIGSSHVRAVAGRQNNGRLDIIATGKSNSSGYLLNGNIVNINKTSLAISDVISQIETAIPGKNKDYYFSSNLSGNHIHVFLYTSTKQRKNPNEAVTEMKKLKKRSQKKILAYFIAYP